ncbi:MAG: hypothetical protein ACREMZ_07485 [Gemmatimonadales bacterium]
MIIQTPAPPVPPTPPPPPFDPNLIFLEGGPPVVLMIVVAALGLVATTIILWPIVRALARRLEGRGTGDAALRAEIEHLHARVGDVDSLQARVLELEERVDFAERLLAQGQSRREIVGGEGI